MYRKLLVVGDGGEVELKTDGESAGEVIARFATLDTIDRHGDVVLPGSIGQQKVLMGSYGHGSFLRGAFPIGKGSTSEAGHQALFKGHVFMDLPHAQQEFELIKAVGDQQQFSFSLHGVDAQQGTHGGKSARLLKQIDVHEVCPVYRGAGVDTQLLAIKQQAALSGPQDADLKAEVERLQQELDAKDDDIKRLASELEREQNLRAAELFRLAGINA